MISDYKHNFEIAFAKNPEKSRTNLKRIVLEYLDRRSVKRKKNSGIATAVLRVTNSKNSNGIYLYLRMFLTRLFPFDPLSGTPQSNFGIIVLVSAKDLQILPYSLTSIIRNYPAEIETIWIIGPDSIREQIWQSVNAISKQITPKINCISDEEILEQSGLSIDYFDSSVAKMEFIKIASSTFHPSDEILVLDCDTLYLKRRVWSNSNSVVLVLAQEYFVEHVNFHFNIFHLRSKSGMGFVTHHSYFLRNSITDMVTKFGGLRNLALHIRGGILRGFASGSFPSEWQMYGDWILEMSSKEVKVVSFNNLGVPREIFPLLSSPNIDDIDRLLQKIRSTSPDLGSLSLHDYK